MTLFISAISSLELRRQRDRDKYARLTDEQKAQRNVRRRENYARKKAGMSCQIPSTPVDSGVGTAVPASGAWPI